jgi:hypothetical protein
MSLQQIIAGIVAGNVHPKMYGIGITVTKAGSYWAGWPR